MQADLLDYVSRDSPLHRLDARWRLVGIVTACAALVFLKSVVAAAIGLLGALAALAAARLPLAWIGQRLGGLALFLMLFVVVLPLTMPGDAFDLGLFRLSLPGLHLAGLICLKALSISALVLLLFATAPVGVTLRAAHRLWVPDLLVQLLMLTYLHAYLLADELGKVRIALRLRRFRNRMNRHAYRTLGNVAGTLLVRSYERAERVGQAMKARGFSGRFRTLHRFHTSPADVFGAGLIAAVGVAPLLAELLATVATAG
jgi:cobalt/nickel transport system permease protein